MCGCGHDCHTLLQPPSLTKLSVGTMADVLSDSVNRLHQLNLLSFTRHNKRSIKSIRTGQQNFNSLNGSNVPNGNPKKDPHVSPLPYLAQQIVYVTRGILLILFQFIFRRFFERNFVFSLLYFMFQFWKQTIGPQILF